MSESAELDEVDPAHQSPMAGGLVIASARRGSREVRFSISVLVGVLLLWWVIAAAKLFPMAILATPASVVKAARTSGSFVVSEVGVTLEQVVMALAVAWIGGLILGLLFGATKTLSPLLGLARSAYAVPVVIIYPIFAVWFGYGSASKVAFGAIAGLVPMILMSASAVATVDRKILQLFTSFSPSRTALLRKAILPASLPGILSAMRLSGSLAFVSVIVGQMLVSTNGIGYFIATSSGHYNTPGVYLGICCVIALAIALHSLLGILQKVLGSNRVRNML